MDIDDLIAPEAVLADLKASSKKQALQLMCAVAAKLTGIEERSIFQTVLEREKLGTTGVGQGVAVPHGKMAEVEKITGVFAHLAKPIDFDAVDQQPVDLIFLLLAPENAGADHLKALARISRLLRDKAVCDKMRGTKDSDALYALLTAAQAHAA
ncbi:MAG: PTS IIA-like nitrogen-regulatory protein PtsN [Alphaproteobacteria bacterium]|nr:MAG: PTS IIA-like nitrogen-regulatory protein PtsN [Alphaproteobacteria bacterium]